MQIGLQTFTIKNDLKSRASIQVAFDKIKKMGINSIEFARISFDKNTVKEVNDICTDLDIKIRASQLKLKRIRTDLNFTLKTHQMWNCKLMAVSVIPLPYLLKGIDGFKRLANELNNLGQKAKQEGIQLLFHHHHFEFASYLFRSGVRVTGFDILNNLLNFEDVKFALDTYWIQRGGYDPVNYIKKMSGKVKVVHLRDYYLKPGLISPSVSDTPLGEGTLNFKEIILAAETAGVEQLSIEQASSNPYKDIQKSIKHIKSISMDSYL